MALENVFSKHFKDSLDNARTTSIHGAFAAGSSYGLSQALIYLTQALLFWVGAKFIANGTYTYLCLMEVLNLLIFSVSISGQLMTFGGLCVLTLFSSCADMPLISPPHCQVEAGCGRLWKAPRVGSLHHRVSRFNALPSEGQCHP